MVQEVQKCSKGHPENLCRNQGQV